MKKIKSRFINETISSKANEIMEKLKFNKPGTSFDYVEENLYEIEMSEGETCEKCGSELKEGECLECGMKEETIYEIEVHEDECKECWSKSLDEKWEGDVEVKKTGEHAGKSIEQLNKEIKALKAKSEKYQEQGKKVPKDMKEKMSELYFAKRSKKGWPGKGKVDVDEEMEEGNAFTDALRKTKKGEKFKLGGKTYTDNSSLEESVYYEVNYKGQTKLLSESNFVNFISRLAKKSNNEVTYKIETKEGDHLFTESELINVIEEIVLKEEKKFNKGLTPKGYSEYERSVKKSKKENDDYLTSVGKKMKDYLKDGSKGDYEENPKHFPKGNGQLEKMKAHKYTMSDDGNEFLDDYMRPGMEDLVPDEIQYDVDWTTDGVKGASRTGNNPKWGNAEETELGEKMAKKMKNKKFHKAKMAAYNKAKQPVTDGTGANSGSGINIKLETLEERKEKVLTEEFKKIQNLISYDRKTQ